MHRTALRRSPLWAHTAQAALRRTLELRSRQAPSRPLSSMPTIAQTSFWKSLIPKPFRRDRSPEAAALRKSKPKGWNPATFYIAIFLLIGSMSIQLIVLNKDFDKFIRQSDVRIGLLREVVERIQKGEEVDVEGVLGTGNPEKEIEWEQVLQEIERDDASRNLKKREKKAPDTPAVPAHMPKADSRPGSTQPGAKPKPSASFF